MPAPRATDKWAPRETRYVAEYTAREFPKAKVFLRVRLGAADEQLVAQYGVEKANNMMKPFKRWADALVIMPNKAIIIEAKIRGQIGMISQLEYYGTLFRETPEYRAYQNLPVELWILTPWSDPALEAFAQRKGIIIKHWIPTWLEQYVEDLQHYRTASWRLARSQD